MTLIGYGWGNYPEEKAKKNSLEDKTQSFLGEQIRDPEKYKRMMYLVNSPVLGLNISSLIVGIYNPYVVAATTFFAGFNALLAYRTCEKKKSELLSKAFVEEFN